MLMALRFPKSARLQSTMEFRRVRTEGSSRGGEYLVLGILRTGSDRPPRLGLVTTKRIGGAVVRNRVRRKCREIVRKHLSAVEPGVWMVVIARKQAGNASLQRLEADWLRLARRTSILNPASSEAPGS